MPIQSAADLKRLTDVIIGKLEAGNQREAANKLRRIQETSFTTSSEWWGELGLAVRSIQKEVKVDQDIRQGLDEIMRLVKRAWPRL
jgi:hypothetical protein